MNCEQLNDLLADYLGEELDASDRKAIEAHLTACDFCRREVSALGETVRAMNRLDAPPLEQHSPVVRFRLLQPLAYAAILLIGIGVGWQLKPGVTPGDRPSEPTAVHAGRFDSALTAATVGGDTPFARNTVKLMRALSAGGL